MLSIGSTRGDLYQCISKVIQKRARYGSHHAIPAFEPNIVASTLKMVAYGVTLGFVRSHELRSHHL